MLAIMARMTIHSPSKLEDIPILVAGVSSVAWLTKYGELQEISLEEAKLQIIEGNIPISCHMPVTAGRLGLKSFDTFDLLELFAFVMPAHLQFQLRLVRPRR